MPAAAPQVTLKDVAFTSPSVGREMHYRILLPAGYAQTNHRYPVLYLLHGLTGSYVDWESRTNLARYAEPLELIIVMPDAGDSWYTNSATQPNDKFEDYIARDLIAEIDQNYRTVASGYARAIAGLSMGGYGAAKIALRYPNQFAFAGSLSGGFEATGGIESVLWREDLKEHWREIYGPAGSQTRSDNDVFALLKNAAAKPLPYFFIDCGSSDRLLPSSREFVAQLQQQKVAYEYHELPGAHTWQYWDNEIQTLLASLVRQMRVKVPRGTSQAGDTGRFVSR